jgi:aspartate carbamoyltransferase catalytic subunit
MTWTRPCNGVMWPTCCASSWSDKAGDGIANFPSLREYAMLFGLDLDRYRRIGKDVVIMHPGPINRGVEITSEVADHANSIILDQVENGVAIRMAVLYLLAARIPRQSV